MEMFRGSTIQHIRRSNRKEQKQVLCSMLLSAHVETDEISHMHHLQAHTTINLQKTRP